MKMEDMPLSGPDNTKLEVSKCLGFVLPLSVTNRQIVCFVFHQCVFEFPHCLVSQALVHDIYSELVEDACLGLCFEVHRAVKQGYFFLDETDQESMKDFGNCHGYQFGLFFLCSLLIDFIVFPWLFQKLWISQEWTYLAKCTISGKTKSVSARNAKDWLQPLVLLHIWRNVWAWDATAVASPAAGQSVKGHSDPQGDEQVIIFFYYCF